MTPRQSQVIITFIIFILELVFQATVLSFDELRSNGIIF